jgi:hypothetical protein
MSPLPVAERTLALLRIFMGKRFAALTGMVGGAALGAAVVVALWPGQPVEAAASAEESAPQPCENQTWPYISEACLRVASDEVRHVRVVSTARDPQASDQNSVHPVSKGAAAASAASVKPARPAAEASKRAYKTVAVYDGRARGHQRRVDRRASARSLARLDAAARRAPLTIRAPQPSDDKRSVLAYGEDDHPAQRFFAVPSERSFGIR